ncbi:hypothetical protein C7H19_00030 [Aphanothece hegewaldii CCALA 016]|uniref:Glycosyl hydrolase-like 10 domain-containing protein n=1 Tax=Aphanothece hegewaldii CCALA 016 TaxID=2107694 RepID=A0A2T1M311_9CHRO|nr:family 10 glycosylhydrolase [Aphanothece hegewaldii]PSF39215.1 hypothetical protein C7H19_00030 [Aphanothece hegewaldii CCALA 016]
MTSQLLFFNHPSGKAAMNEFCQFTSSEINAKQSLLQTALKGSNQAQKDYNSTIRKHADSLRRCRAQSWLQEQSIWLRLYSCDARPGSIDEVLDRIVNKGYNKIYVEVFSDSQVLLPANDNPTPWDSVVRYPGAENVDLLAQVIQKGHERGLVVYAWLFSMNFGYAYAQRSDRQDVLARNGKGETSLSFVHDQSQAFIDPYNTQAQQDYYQLLQAIFKRRPDGILFDYIRYPRGSGNQSAAGEVKDLWIYGTASRNALLNRSLNNKGRALLDRYVTQGYITPEDIIAVDKLYPDEGSPLWQGRVPPEKEMEDPVQVRFQRLKNEIWYFTVAHAAQGVIDYLTKAATLAQNRGIPAGAVFFPDGNQPVGEKGFDSRLQAWDRFPTSIEWHPMSYAVCNQANCITEQVKRVISAASPQTQVIPALAGQWGRIYDNRPSLEEQMLAIRNNIPRIKSISHFAFSWQESEFDKERRFCRN